jgi:hypothetical protein
MNTSGIQCAHDTKARQRGVGDERQARPRVVVDDTATTWKRRPSVKASETKSRLQRAWARSGTSMGLRLPSARLRPPFAQRQALRPIRRRSFF